MKKQSVCFVAGHSGGHIIPCITLAHALQQKNPDTPIIFFTTSTSLDQQLTKNLGNNIKIISLPLTTITTHNPLRLTIALIKLGISCIKSLYHVIRTRPTHIISTGGLCALPVFIAARIVHIPIDLYELNVIPGKSIYALAPFARTVYCCFNRTRTFLPNTSVYAPYPLRFVPLDTDRASIRTQLGLDPYKKTVLIVGGSQGSVSINNAIYQWLTDCTETHALQIIHQTGAFDSRDWNAIYAQHHITALTCTFSSNIQYYYTAADLVICRSGAGTLFEVLSFKIPCITIPLERLAGGHQVHNAFTMAHENPTLFHVMTEEQLQSHPESLTILIHQKLNLVIPSATRQYLGNPITQMTSA